MASRISMRCLGHPQSPTSASVRGGELEFAGPAILRPPSYARAEWAKKFATMLIEKPALPSLKRANKAQFIKPEIRVRVRLPEGQGHTARRDVEGPDRPMRKEDRS